MDSKDIKKQQCPRCMNIACMTHIKDYPDGDSLYQCSRCVGNVTLKEIDHWNRRTGIGQS